MLAQASKQRSRHAGVACRAQTACDVALNPLVPFEVSGNEIGGFLGADSQLLGQPVRSLSKDDAKIDSLSAVALRRSDLVHRNSQHFRCSSTVNVFTAMKRFGEARVARQMRDNTQL